MKGQLHVQDILHIPAHIKDKIIIVLFSALRDLVHDAGLFGLEVSDLANLNKIATQQKVS